MNRPTADRFVTRSTSRVLAGTLARIAFSLLGVIALVAASPGGAAAESLPAKGERWEFLVSSGGVVPLGAQRRSIGDAALSSAQLSRVVRPSLALTATVGWARGRDLESVARPRLDIVGADVGAELRGASWSAGRGLMLRPFAAIGAGARRYDSRGASAAITDRLAAYAGAGAELGMRRMRVRLEARDYVTGHRAPDVGEATTPRHELALTAGLRWVSR